MNKYEITNLIENYAPLELAESWDCSGWIVETTQNDVNKIMLCLTVTDDIIKQALNKKCDMIISHHPLFFVPNNYKNIDIYCAHTNMDMTKGGTTDTLIQKLGYEISYTDGFVRYVDVDTNIKDLSANLKKISNNIKLVNNKNINEIKRIAFCSGSGSEFIKDAQNNNADVFITGDVKFHTAVDSEIAIFDIGHFESEIPIIEVFKEILPKEISIEIAKEKSPFIPL